MQNILEREAVVYVQVFLYLQILDFLTTLVGLKMGISEASPLIRSLLHLGPGIAVATTKILALGLAGVCLTIHREYVIRWVNYWYAAIIVWNLCNILAV
jgi:hypothetical protein